MAEIILISSSDSEPENAQINHGLFTERGHEKRVFEGFTFTFEKNSHDGRRSFWSCDHRVSDHCKARVHYSIRTGALVKRINGHSHEADPSSINVMKIKQVIKTRAGETMEVITYFFYL